jgi:hypothetical protein
LIFDVVQATSLVPPLGGQQAVSALEVTACPSLDRPAYDPLLSFAHRDQDRVQACGANDWQPLTIRPPVLQAGVLDRSFFVAVNLAGFCFFAILSWLVTFYAAVLPSFDQPSFTRHAEYSSKVPFHCPSRATRRILLLENLTSKLWG